MNFGSRPTDSKKDTMRKRNKRRAKLLRQRSSGKTSADYGQLEPRNLLASVEVGLNFTGTLGGVDVTTTRPDIAGAVGPDHIIEIVNERYTVFDKEGTLVETSNLNDFWSMNAGATLAGNSVDARIIYDAISEKWFAMSHGDQVDSQIYIGISETSNPTEGWTSVQFDADLSGTDTVEFATFGIDANGVYVSTNNDGPVVDELSLFSIPKRDLIDGTPTLARLTRFEGLSSMDFGSTIQIAHDRGISSRAIGLSTFGAGNTIIRTDIVGSSGPGAGLTGPISITVPGYQAGPDGRQPTADVLQNVSPQFTSNTVRALGSVWAVHSVEGTSNNSALRWYQIDDSTSELLNWGTIEDPLVDYLYPSIAVNEFGTIAIGMTATGPELLPSSAAVTGFVTSGLENTPNVEFGTVSILREGLEAYSAGTEWGNYSSTQIDPSDPFSFWTFQEYASMGNNWSTRITEVGLFDATPTIRANADNNRIVIRNSASNADWVEVEIDGVVTDTLERRSLTSLNVDGQGGDDDIFIDLRFGDPIPFSGITVRGNDGNDTLQVFGGTTGQNWTINGDGSGVIDGKIRFLNFEQLVGSDLDDVFTVEETGTDLVIFGGDGNDLFDIKTEIVGNLELRGEDGDDTYRLPIDAVTTVQVIDDNGEDVLIAFGTSGDDVITIDNNSIVLNGVLTTGFIFDGVESAVIQGLEGVDTFNVVATQTAMVLEGGDDNDVFNIGNASGVNSDLTGPLTIDGENGNDRIVIDVSGTTGVDAVVTDSVIMGVGSADITYVSAGDVPMTDTEIGIKLLGSSTGADLVEVSSLLADVSLGVYGDGGNDIITVRAGAAGDVRVDGQAGSDTVQIGMKNLTGRTVQIRDTGTNSDDIDRVNVVVTDGEDVFEIKDSVLAILSEQVLVDEAVEVWVVNTAGGADIVTVAANSPDYLRVITGDANDIVTTSDTNGMTGLRFDLGDGDDHAQLFNAVDSTFVNVRAGDGDDLISTTDQFFASGRFDGEDGSDTLNIESIGFTTRRINARDTGATGTDKLNIVGSVLVDDVTILKARVSNRAESVLYDGNTESLFVDTGFLSDTVTIQGVSAPLLIVNTSEGNDIINVASTSGAQTLIVNGGIGNDGFIVSNTAVESDVHLRGDNGDDTFDIGATFAGNGNLNKIRSRVTIDGGANNTQDRLFVNDRASQSNYDYLVTANRVTSTQPTATGSNVRAYAGVFQSGIESVRVDGNDRSNRFEVLSSSMVDFFISGGSQTAGRGDFLEVLSADAGRVLNKNASNDGFWSFSNGERDIRFTSIETDSN